MAPTARLRSIPLGERALRFELAGAPAVLARAACALAQDPQIDAVAGSTSILVVAAAPIDPLRRAALTTAVASALADASRVGAGSGAGERRHTIDVVYDGADLVEIAAATSMSPSDVAARHAEPEYVVQLGGFFPGFAYLGEVAPPIRHPRRAQPRHRVDAGAVGIAGRQTGIYPSVSPGGWNLVGRAILPAPLFDPNAEPPARFAVGDRVRFVAVSAADSPPRTAALDTARAMLAGEHDRAGPNGSAALTVDRVAAVATVQDAGRARWLRAGVPASGAMDPVALASANLAVGNDPSAAGIEIAVGTARFVARRDVLISIDGEAPRRLLAGDTLEVAAAQRLSSYLAIRGGVAVPAVLGSRSTALAAALGGLHGRALRRGDSIAIEDDPGTKLPDRRRLVVPSSAAETVLRIDVIPPCGALSAASVDALLSSRFTVSTRLDRVGIRLEGATVPRTEVRDALPEPVVPGVVQIASDGTPMVLGPDAAVTGGYPVIGVLRKTSLWALYRLRPGAFVRFVRGVSG